MAGADDLTWGVDGIPLWSIGVLALVFGWVWYIQWRHARREALKKRGPLARLLDAAPLTRDVLRGSLVVIAAALIVVALKKPRLGASTESMKALGIDVAFVLDASKSMKVNDVVPDRLDAAKLEIVRTLEAMHGGRAALVPFAGLAYTQAPLTGDFAVTRSYLEELRVEDMPRGGTAIGRAIMEAMRALFPDELAAEEVGPDDAERQITPFEGAKHKVIVLFTDGEDHEGDALAAADEAARRGVKIYTVGVGTPQGRPVLEIDDQGRVTGTVKGPDGTTPLFSSLNVKLLRDVAEKTGGGYFLLGPEGLGQGLLERLAELEKQEYEDTYVQVGDERYAWVVVPALLLLCAELWLGGRRRRIA
ncbi:MAG: VWA domain-containing protein [Deltaproteobacteria bacterium]|nr:VWA domain-containing protein [Deltaproteobacteria bacterium]